VEFGLFVEWPNAGARVWREAFEESVAQVRLAEEVGFDFCLIAEHHFSDYSIAPSPLLEALAFARATSRIRIGTGVAVLPEWQPLRLAEEMAVVDQLSSGRFIAGVGRGFVPFEQERLGVVVDEGRARFEESLDALVQAWTATDFTYAGKHVRIDHPTTVLPRPLQVPHPPIWLAGASAESVDLVGRRGLTPIISGAAGVDRLREQHGDYVRARHRYGRGREPLHVVAQTQVHVAETTAEAHATLPFARWQARAVTRLVQARIEGGVLDVTPAEDDPSDEVLLGRQFIGTPDEIIPRLQALNDAGVTHVSMLMEFGGLDAARIERSIRLVGRDVIPALRAATPPASLAAGALAASG
jgi:alkanesulfonate monooxygenase SsuD/methylene tetrahydromethanopterin reductase-like flavin-dependent oxidoreductase (luciferase family)